MSGWKLTWSRSTEGDGEEPRGQAVPREGYRAFQDWAVHLAQWQWQRADAFERKAVGLLGAVALVLTVSPVLGVRIAALPGGYAVAAVVGAGVALLALISSAICSAMSLRSRASSYASIDQVRLEWCAYKQNTHLTDEAVRGLFADQLLGPGGDESPLVALRRDADARGKWFTAAVWAFFIGIGGTAASTATIVIEGVMS